MKKLSQAQADKQADDTHPLLSAPDFWRGCELLFSVPSMMNCNQGLLSKVKFFSPKSRHFIIKTEIKLNRRYEKYYVFPTQSFYKLKMLPKIKTKSNS